MIVDKKNPSQNNSQKLGFNASSNLSSENKKLEDSNIGVILQQRLKKLILTNIVGNFFQENKLVIDPQESIHENKIRKNEEYYFGKFLKQVK